MSDFAPPSYPMFPSSPGKQHVHSLLLPVLHIPAAFRSKCSQAGVASRLLEIIQYKLYKEDALVSIGIFMVFHSIIPKPEQGLTPTIQLHS